MAADDIQRKLDEIDRRVEAVHTAIVGDLGGRPGLVQRVADLDARIQRLEGLTGIGKTIVGGALAAVASAYALLWGGPHGK